MLTKEQNNEFNQLIRPLLSHTAVKKMTQFTQHGDTTCLRHCVHVAYCSFALCRKLKLNIDEESLVRGALLHDFFLYDWHDKTAHARFHGFTHPQAALDNAAIYFQLTATECDIIRHHMWPLTPMPPHTLEGYVVTMADKYCSLKETIKRPKIRHLMAKYLSFINNEPDSRVSR